MRRWFALSLVALLTLPAAGAAGGGAIGKDRAPSAHLEAAGTGRIVLAGRLVAYGQMPAPSRLVVRDMAGDATVMVAGQELEPNARGWVRLPRATGRLYVSGSRVTVRLAGTALSLAVAGNGAALLDGQGRYWLNDEGAGEWGGGRIRLEPAREAEVRAGSARQVAAPRR